MHAFSDYILSYRIVFMGLRHLFLSFDPRMGEADVNEL